MLAEVFGASPARETRTPPTPRMGFVGRDDFAGARG
jgi:hypothetical protein